MSSIFPHSGPPTHSFNGTHHGRKPLTGSRWIQLLLVCSGLALQAGEVTTTYEVTLNGQKFKVPAETTTNVMVDGKEMKLSAREMSEKTFADGNISFAFPTTHAVSKEVEDGITTWTLDGQDNVLILLNIKGADPTEVGKETVKSLIQQYGAKSKQSNCKVTLGSETMNGTKITAELAGHTLIQEVYEMKAGPDGYILIIQDSGETESPDTRRAKALLKESFKRVPVSTPK